MKKLFGFAVFLSLFTPVVHAELRAPNAPKVGVVYTVDTSATNLPATYGHAGNTYSGSLVGYSNVCVVNGTSTKLYGAASATATCTGASDQFVFPPNQEACYGPVQLNTYFCLRSSSGSLSSGVNDAVFN